MAGWDSASKSATCESCLTEGAVADAGDVADAEALDEELERQSTSAWPALQPCASTIAARSGSRRTSGTSWAG